MKNTNSSGSIAARLKNGTWSDGSKNALLKAVVAVMAGLLLPRATVYGDLSPFGLGLAAAVSGPAAIPVFLSTFIGYLFNGNAGSLRYLAALIAIVGFRWSVSGFPRVSRSVFFAPIITLLSSLVTGSTLLLTDGRTLSDVIYVISESLLAGGFSYFCVSFFSEHTYEIRKESDTELKLGTIFVFSAMMMALFKLQWYDISLGRILSVLCILAASRCGGITGGSIAGSIFGLTAFLTDPVYLYLVPTYTFGGLLAGFFSGKGRIASTLVFAAVNGIVFSVMKPEIDVSFIIGFYEILAASVLLFLLPASIERFVETLFSKKQVLNGSRQTREAVALKMKNAAKTMSDVAGTVDSISKELSTSGAPNTGSVYRSVADSVCVNCKSRLNCWEHHFSDVMDSFNHMTPLLDMGKDAEESEVVGYLKEHCSKLSDICQHLNESYKDYRVRESAFQRLYELRGIINDQFQNTAKILQEFSDQFEKPEWNDSETAQTIEKLLIKEHVPVQSTVCRIEEDSHMEIELVISQRCVTEEANEIRKCIEKCCDRIFATPTVEWNGSETRICLSEGQLFRTEIGTAQRHCKGEKLCGDAFEIFRDNNGNQFVILSDGMGCGGRAAVDGAMTAGLTAELLKAGFGYESVLRIVNTALMTKSEDETLATLDVACINLFTGELELLKAGAGASLLLSKTRVSRLDESSLPLGILRELTFTRTRDRLVDGDILLLMSDGISNDGTRWVEELLRTFDIRTGSVQTLSNIIVETAGKFHKEDKGDDMTVIAIKIEKADMQDIQL